MLETTECIRINNNGKIYTDCMEFSLLRFVHILMYDPKQMFKKNCSEYISNIEYNEYFKDFVKKNPVIYPNANYYLSNPNGIQERNEWTSIVSNIKSLDYYRNDMAELFTSITNLIKFVNEFFNKNYNINEFENSLKQISTDFSTEDKKISLSIKSTNVKQNKMYMDEIIRYISRPEDKYKNYLNKDKIFEVITTINYLELKINDYEYEWMLYEIIIKNNGELNEYITGHSVITVLV